MQEYYPKEYCQEVLTGAILDEITQIETDTQNENEFDIYINQSLDNY